MAKRRNHAADAISLIMGIPILLFLVLPVKSQSLIGTLQFFAFLFAAGFIAVMGFCVIRLIQRSINSNSVRESKPTLAAEDFRILSRGWNSKSNSKGELLDKLRSIDWFQFEKLVAELYRKRGYTVASLGGANSDGGIDLCVVKEGQEWAIQCKHWKTWKVGVGKIRELLGALTDAGIQKGILITLQGCTQEAKLFAEKHGIQIINEKDLLNMLESVDARFDPKMIGLLEDTRKFCPKCDSEMVLRTSGKGRGAGNKFWGCSAFPKCRYTLSFS